VAASSSSLTSQTQTYRPLHLPPSNAPLTSILFDTASYQNNFDILLEKVAMLDAAIQWTLEYCPVCWVLTGYREPVHEEDVFAACFPGSRQFPQMLSWLDLKKQMRFIGLIAYCFGCSVPAHRYQPHHGDGMGMNHCQIKCWEYWLIWVV